MKFPLYISSVSKFNMLEDWILIHSILYYDYNVNIVSDYIYDNNMKQLYRMIQEYPKSFKKSKLYKTYKEFAGSTGYDLRKRCLELQKKEFERIESNAKLLMYYAKEIWKVL